MLKTKLVSSMVKPFLDDSMDDKREFTSASMLKNERLSFQLLYSDPGREDRREFRVKHARVSVSSELSPYLRLRTVEQVQTLMPTFDGLYDEDYLRTEPGLYPDPILPLRDHDRVILFGDRLYSIWVDVDPRGNAAEGEYPIRITLTDDDGNEASQTFTVRILDAFLPEQDFYVTQWFHADCLANYYNVPVFSQRHWEIVEAFMRTAAENGQTAIYLPLVTPPLDTAVGGERTTVQLVEITLRNGEYTFGFGKLDRWCDLAVSIGFRFFEVVHLFTQWGAAHAPKVMATVDGEYRKLFGWETDSLGEEYRTFVRALLRAFLAHMKARGLDAMCRFHISDEPSAEQLETYRAAKDSVADLLAGYVISDALSSFDFYEQGILETPTPAADHIQPFLDAHVKHLNVYYCCGQWKKVTNRFVAMPGARTRILGVQMYRNGVEGFLHWGYNFYNNRLSTERVDPWQTNSGDYMVPAGDPFLVYPGMDGTPVETIRLKQFGEAMQDLRALKLCERLCGAEAVHAVVDRCGPVRFDEYPRDEAYLLELRRQINEMIAEKTAG